MEAAPDPDVVRGSGVSNGIGNTVGNSVGNGDLDARVERRGALSRLPVL